MIVCAEAFGLMASLEPASVDLILTDPPYGQTQNAWDTAPDLPALWQAFERVLKPTGAVVLTAINPFAARVIAAQEAWYRHEWVWQKHKSTDFLNANRRPLRLHELVLVFGPRPPRYFPQMRTG